MFTVFIKLFGSEVLIKLQAVVEKADLYFVFLQKCLKKPVDCAISGNSAGNMIKYIHIVKASA